MKLEVVTTITSLVDIDTFVVTHDVDITPEAGVPESVAVSAATGGLRATLNELGYDSVERDEG